MSRSNLIFKAFKLRALAQRPSAFSTSIKFYGISEPIHERPLQLHIILDCFIAFIYIMLCDSCQRLNLDQICGLAAGDTGSIGYELTSRSERISHYNDGFEEIRLSCDVCQAIFGTESSRFPFALLSSAEPGVLPMGSLKDGLHDQAGLTIKSMRLFDVFCSQGMSSPWRLYMYNTQ